MSFWIYLHFPALQLDSIYGLCSQNPDEQQQGVAIVEGRKNEIVQLNRVAREQGVKTGMGLATAASLCSHMHVLEYDACKEVEKLKELAHWLYVITADISLFEPNGILLSASNMLTLYDGLENYWQAIVGQLSNFPFSYGYASGYSPFAARMLARKQFNTISASKSTLVHAVKRCSLSETELNSQQITKLNRVGVTSVSDLLSIPMADIAKRFDVDLVNYVGKLTGQFHHTVEVYQPPEKFVRYLDLLFEIENLSLLEKPLLRLLRQLEDFLRVRDQYAHELSLEMVLRNGQSHTLAVTSASGDYQKEAWLNLFKLKFESVRLGAPVVRIALSAIRTAARKGDVADLFDGKRGRLSPLELLSILQAKLGDEAVRGLQITDDPRPHLSSQFCAPLSKQTPPARRDKNLMRPSILLPSPRPLKERVSIVQGPERIATGWWDGQSMTRDYFIARAANGCWLWIFRTPSRQWFLHGVFS